MAEKENQDNVNSEEIDSNTQVHIRAARLAGLAESSTPTREAWQDKTTTDIEAESDSYEINPDSFSPPSAIEGTRLISESGDGVKASIEGSYDTVFGRDSAVIGLSLVEKQPELARNIIISLATRQGVVDNPKSEENPGKIHHEERTDGYGKSKIRNAVGKIVEKMWTNDESGSEKPRRISYVSADSTPLYIKLVSEYCKYHGDDILKETITSKNGETITIGDSIEAATSWIESKIGPDGFVEVERRNKAQNPFGQTWKDSITAMIRPDGSLVNVRGRIVLPELQTLSIDALEASAHLLETTDPDLAEKRKQEAHKIRINTLVSMWSEEDGFFISGIEGKADGTMSPIKTLESTAGRLLNSSLFDELDETERKHYVEAITEKLFSDDFLTEVGIRTRALRYGKTLDTADYHGSYVSWPTDTFQIAEGLRRQGLPALAEQLENRLLNAVNMSSKAYEFFFVNKDGLPILDYKGKKSGQAGSISMTIAPQHNQGWTFSAALDIKRQRGERRGVNETAKEGTWQAALEQKILLSIRNVQPYKTKAEMAQHYPSEVSDTKLDKASGYARTGGYIASELIKQYKEHKDIR